MLLLTGPPGSGKSWHVLEEFRRSDSAVLLVPTATMAEHLQNQIAREGLALRPGRITTLSRFIEPWAREIAQASPAIVEQLVGNALDRLDPIEFRRVFALTGFRAALARLMEELSTADCGPADLPAGRYSQALASVYADLEAELAKRKLGLRRRRLHLATNRIRRAGMGSLQRILFDGFFSFTAPELALVHALAKHADLTITLPAWTGAEPALRALRQMGFSAKVCDHVAEKPKIVRVAAATVDRETEEIARRILEAVAAGRQFREIGIIARDRSYAPALRTSFERFGIASRTYAGERLNEQPAVRYFAKIVEAIDSGWNHEPLVAALRMAVSGATDDRFDFAARAGLPGRGLDPLLAFSPNRKLRGLLRKLSRLDIWRTRTAPAERWATDLRKLRALVRRLEPADQAAHELANIWRAEGGALKAFDAALDECAASSPGSALTLSEFWKELQVFLENSTIRIADRRHNVVHILDAYEARQWRLPVVFVCGLIERQFPRYHEQDPLLPDQERIELRQAGYQLSTSHDRQAEEEFLFDLAATRASSLLVLSHPLTDAKGEATLHSFFLDGIAAEKQGTVAVRPAPPWPQARAYASRIQDPALRERLRDRHKTLSPTSIESYLQCPFQFFAEKTIHLRPRPPRPDERLNALEQGSIMHRVLAEIHRTPQLAEQIFELIFEEARAKLNVPLGYRTEAVRADMMRNLRLFLADRSFPPGWEQRTEESFEFDLDGAVIIRGRIDRLDCDGEGRAVVVDYKYSAANTIKKRVEQSESGELVQAGLYVMAAERVFKVQPAGMLYCGLKKEVRWDGWHVELTGFERLGETRTPEAFRELISAANGKALHALEEIRGGRTAPAPANRDKCDWCDYSGICRIESATGAVEEASEWT